MASFILENMEEILVEWDAFAATQTPAADAMDAAALRDHAKQMLQAIAEDIQTSQTNREQDLKAKGLGPSQMLETAAEAHGALRQQVGFDLGQLIAEFRALRASVLKIWMTKKYYGDEQKAYEIARFHEAIDQALTESVSTFSSELGRSRDTFLGILGHDLRSPLGAVWNAVEILAKSNDDAARGKAFDSATRSLGSMRTMIADLLDFTRTRLGKGIPVMPAVEDLERICRNCVNEVALAYPKSTIEFAAAGVMEGEFDRERMQQVFSNLLGNAIRHSERGTGVAMVAKAEGDMLRVDVNNRGKPIPPQSLETIFDPLVQLGDSRPATGHATNMGLGLYIAREIVHAHGGSIKATSSEADGTTFSVVLPRTGKHRVAASVR